MEYAPSYTVSLLRKLVNNMRGKEARGSSDLDELQSKGSISIVLRI